MVRFWPFVCEFCNSHVPLDIRSGRCYELGTFLAVRFLLYILSFIESKHAAFCLNLADIFVLSLSLSPMW